MVGALRVTHLRVLEQARHDSLRDASERDSIWPADGKDIAVVVDPSSDRSAFAIWSVGHVRLN